MNRKRKTKIKIQRDRARKNRETKRNENFNEPSLEEKKDFVKRQIVRQNLKNPDLRNKKGN